jgi:hypothetical protein
LWQCGAITRRERLPVLRRLRHVGDHGCL